MNEKRIQLLQHLLSYISSYHHHKESMAHAGLGLMLALLIGIVVTDEWPPEAVSGEFIEPYLLVFPVVCFALIHVFIRWQLRRRRDAAIRATAFQRELVFELQKMDTDNENSFRKRVNENTWLDKIVKCICVSHSGKMTFWGAILLFIDAIVFPIPFAPLPIDSEDVGYPNKVMTRIETLRTTKSVLYANGILHEAIISSGSVLFIAAVILRTYFYGE